MAAQTAPIARAAGTALTARMPNPAVVIPESDDRIFAVAAWRESPYFTEAERAALALGSATGPTRCPMRSGTRPPGTTTSLASRRSSS